MTENWQEPVVYPPVSAQPAPPPPKAAPTSGYGFTVPVGPAPAPIVAQPLSDKSRTVAGLLQLVPGLVLGLNGLGRLYAGQVTLGAVQLAFTVVGWLAFWTAPSVT